MIIYTLVFLTFLEPASLSLFQRLALNYNFHMIIFIGGMHKEESARRDLGLCQFVDA